MKKNQPKKFQNLIFNLLACTEILGTFLLEQLFEFCNYYLNQGKVFEVRFSIDFDTPPNIEPRLQIGPRNPDWDGQSVASVTMVNQPVTNKR